MSSCYLNQAQFTAELDKCLKCPAKPCMQACPVKCSPHDFIAAAKAGDMVTAAALIAKQNPLGEVCGLVCPDKFCVKACLRRHIDAAVKIPAVQAAIMRFARENKMLPEPQKVVPNGKKIAIIGTGPAGIGAVSVLVRKGFAVTVFEKEKVLGGAVNLIPAARLPREVIAAEWQKLTDSGAIELKFNTEIKDYQSLSALGYAAVIVAVGEQKSRILGIEGENLTVDYVPYLKNPQQYQTGGKVAIVGGGAAAVDCAVTASDLGASQVEMFVRRRIGDMRITAKERNLLLEHNVDITTMTRVTKIVSEQEKITAYTIKTQFNSEGRLVDVEGTEVPRRGFDLIVLALGSTRATDMCESINVFYAGDVANGSSTVVEAVASGQKTAEEVVAKFGC